MNAEPLSPVEAMFDALHEDAMVCGHEALGVITALQRHGFSVVQTADRRASDAQVRFNDSHEPSGYSVAAEIASRGPLTLDELDRHFEACDEDDDGRATVSLDRADFNRLRTAARDALAADPAPQPATPPLAVLRDVRSRIPADQHVALAAIGEAITAIEKGAPAMQSTEPKPLTVQPGVSYPVTLRITPGRDIEGNASYGHVMWSADAEIVDGISATTQGSTAAIALSSLAALVNGRTEWTEGVPEDALDGPMADLAIIAGDHKPTDDELDAIEARLTAGLPHDE